MIADMRVLELGDLVLLDLDRRRRAGGAPEARPVRVQRGRAARRPERGVRASCRWPARGRAGRRRRAGATSGSPGERELAAWPEFRNARAAFRGEMVLVAASRELACPGFDLLRRAAARRRRCGGAAARPAPRRRRRDGGGRCGSRRAGPAFGADMDAETIPLEAGIEDRAISFTKGCYPGQEVIIRVLHRGQGRVARRIVGSAGGRESGAAAGRRGARRRPRVGRSHQRGVVAAGQRRDRAGDAPPRLP